jgi:hypothetical protein
VAGSSGGSRRGAGFCYIHTWNSPRSLQRSQPEAPRNGNR